MKILLFSGGSGTTLISQTLAKNPNIELSLAINGYDDGKSTGKIREFLGNVLGPSDFRKNSINLCENQELKRILEHRIVSKDNETFQSFLDNPIENLSKLKLEDFKILKNIKNLTLDQFNKIFNYFLLFRRFEKRNKKKFDYFDCSIGNLIFAGIFLGNERNFNKTVEDFNNFCEIKVKIFNVTDGTNAYLYGIDSEDNILNNEEKIVNLTKNRHVKEIFLLKKKYNNPNLDFLKANEINPNINKDLKKRILKSDVIIYGPGTQFSSLFPSYLTKDLALSISQNNRALKIFISNIKMDNDIQNLSANYIFEKSIYYLNHKSKISINKKKLFTNILLQKNFMNLINRDLKNYLDFDIDLFKFDKQKIHLENWERASGKHLGEYFHNYLIKLYNKKFNRNLKINKNSISIIVLIKNEIKFIDKLKENLAQIELDNSGIPLEILIIDGGSNDGTLEKIRKFTNYRVYSFDNLKRGEALSKGIELSQGEVVITYPSDCEYSVKDLNKMIRSALIENGALLIGSRNIRNSNITNHINKIYKNKKISFFFSKYGGILISFIMLIFYNRFITDPFSTLKIYDKEIIKNLKLIEKGVNYEIEIMCKLLKKNFSIIEVPVDYFPRGKKDGKKMGLWDGITSLKTLIFNTIT